MIAYNPLWLVNLSIREKAADAFSKSYLNDKELELINNKYPVDFYTPNFFIRAGLFVLTTVVLFFSFGIFSLLLLDSIGHIIGGMVIFFALLSYILLEFMVRSKKHFHSGIDDALLWISTSALCGGIIYLSNAGALASCIIIFIVSLYSCFRFGDSVMSVACYLSLLRIFLFACVNLGTAVNIFTPFVIMTISLVVCLVAKNVNSASLNLLYSRCVHAVYVSTLISFYLSGNYYVVQEYNNAVLNINFAENARVPMGWFFWLFTIAVPLLYVVRSVQKKNIVLLRVGLLLLSVIVFTVKYYYWVGPAEVLMTVGGTVLVIVCYGLTRYLKTPKYGFNIETDPNGAHFKLALEPLIIAQTIPGEQMHPGDSNFGGGSFGGGGASSEF